MPLFSPYFPLESNAYRVGKSGQLRRQMGTAGFGLYVMVLSHLRDCPDCTAELDYDALGYELHEDPALVRRVVEDFGLFLLDREHGTFTAEALREVAAVARPRSRSKRNNAERHRRERKSSRRTTDTADTCLEETTEEADNDDTLSGEETAAAADDTADLFPDETEEEADNADTRSNATAQDDAPTADAAAANESAQPKNDRSLAERKEENKKPSPPIVPLPQGVSGKGETPQNARWEEEAQSRRSAVAVSLPPPSARGDESKLSAVSAKAETNAERPTPSNEMPATAQPITATTAGDLPAMSDPANTASETTPQVVENSTKGEGYAPESEGKFPLVNEPSNTAGETTPQVVESSLDVKEDDERTERNRRPAHWTRERFIAPNAKEVAAYAHFLGRPRFNALQFVLYYESRGWLLQGGLAVADWRSLVKLWLVRGDVQRRGAQGLRRTNERLFGSECAKIADFIDRRGQNFTFVPLGRRRSSADAHHLGATTAGGRSGPVGERPVGRAPRCAQRGKYVVCRPLVAQLPRVFRDFGERFAATAPRCGRKRAFVRLRRRGHR